MAWILYWLTCSEESNSDAETSGVKPCEETLLQKVVLGSSVLHRLHTNIFAVLCLTLGSKEKKTRFSKISLAEYVMAASI